LKFSTQILITTLSKSTTHVSIFILSVILSRYFTKDDYGTYLHIQMIANISIWAFLLGIPHGIYYFLPRAENQRNYVLTTLAMIGSISVIVSAVVFYNTSSLSQLLSNPRIEDLSYVLLCLVFVQIPLTVFEPIMLTAKRVKEFASIELFFNVSFFFAVAIPVYFDRPMVEILWWLVGVYSIHSVIVLYYALLIAYYFKETQVDGDKFGLKGQIKYTLPIGLSMNVMEMSRYVDKIVVSNQSTPDSYALYARGAMEIPVISIIANTLDNLLMPSFVQAYKDKKVDEIIVIWHASIRLMAAFIYPCCLFLICSAPLLIPAIFSEKYIGSVIIFQIYTLGLLSRISTFDIIMRAIGRTKEIFWITLMTVVTNLVLTLLFMKIWGLLGAPIATVLTLLFMRLCYLKAITSFFNITINEVFPWGSILKSLIIACLSSIPVLILYQFTFNVWLHLLIMGVTYSVCYLTLLKLSTSLTTQDKDSVRDLLPRKIKWIL
jgi:O-antigen/teichoic acid export membrane protein